MVGFFIQVIVRIIGHVITLAVIGWAIILTVKELLVYLSPNNGTSIILKYMEFELGPGYQLLVALVLAIIACLIAVYVGRIIIAFGDDGIDLSERFEDLHFVMKAGTVIAVVTSIGGLLMGLYVGGRIVFRFLGENPSVIGLIAICIFAMIIASKNDQSSYQNAVDGYGRSTGRTGNSMAEQERLKASGQNW